MSELTNQNINLLKLSKSVRRHQASELLVKDIIAVFSKIPCLQKLKNNNFQALVCDACNMIENANFKTSKDNHKIDKLQIAISAFQQLFPDLNSDAGSKIISDAVDFCLEKDLVKRLPKSKVVAGKASNFFLKFVGL